MIRSMTGFGRGESICHERRFKVELKSVNHRFNDFTIKVPRFLNPFEDRIRRKLASAIVRGKADVWVSFESFMPSDITIQINSVYADAYMSALRGLSRRYGLGELPADTSLELLAKTQDIIISDRHENALSTETAKEQIWEGLSLALEAALAMYNKMREAEGAALEKDIRDKYAKSVELMKKIRERVPQGIIAHAEKLKDRVSELVSKLGGKADDNRILAEIAMLADKSDINEELTRLESHFEQLNTMLDEKGAIGRKMDFLVQELNREANTIGSKATDIELTRLVVDLKSAIEKIREQIQNIE